MNTGAAPTGVPFATQYLRGEFLIQFWNGLGKLFGIANSFVVLAALSVYQFGLYQLVFAVVLIAESFTTGLFDDMVMNDVARGIAEGRRGDAKRFFSEFAFFKIATSTAIAAALFIGADIVAAYYGKDFGFFLRLASILVVLNALKTAQEIYFTAALSFRGLSVQVIQELSRGALLIAFFVGGPLGIREALLAAIGGSLASAVASSALFLQHYRTIFRGVAATKASLLRRALATYGAWVYLRYAFAKALKGIRLWLIRIFLNTEAVALYTLAVNLITLLQSVFPIEMIGRLLPWEAKTPARLRFIFARANKYALWGGIAVALLGAIAVPPLVEFVLPKYLPAMPVFLLLLLTFPCYGMYKIHKSLLTVLREQKILAARVISESLWVAALDAVLLPFFGLAGVAVEYVLTYLMRVWLFSSALRRYHPRLALRLSALLRFDASDRAFFRRLARTAAADVASRLFRRSAAIEPSA